MGTAIQKANSILRIASVAVRFDRREGAIDEVADLILAARAIVFVHPTHRITLPIDVGDILRVARRLMRPPRANFG
jgi:hypothetical protein